MTQDRSSATVKTAMSPVATEHLFDRLAAASRPWLFIITGGMIAGVASLDWCLGQAVSLGAFYVPSILLLSVALSRVQMLLVAALCATLRVSFNPPRTLAEGILTGAFAFLAYGIIGTFASELMRNRREIQQHLTEIQRQQALRLTAEEQLRLLADSSPAAIFTLDEHAKILSANKATRELLGLMDRETLIGLPVSGKLPVLADALKLDTGETGFRTVSQVQGKRFDGTPFLAQACFSTYKAEDGSSRLAAIAFDSTEDTREREEQSQHQLLESNRIIAGAVAHEVRNVCGAMSVVYSNLESITGGVDNRDYAALGNLINGLGKLAHLELHGVEESRGSSADIRDVLNQLRILVNPAWQGEDAQVEWPEMPHPLLAAVDPFTVLQAFLNIINNSLSAVSNAEERRLTILIAVRDGLVDVIFTDTGSGVTDPDALFQPFRTGASKVGLGLYISRALLRRHGGDVRYEPLSTGARFIVEVPLHGVSTDVAITNKRNPALAGR
jgi:two-component system sensor kinase FixL